MDIDGLAQALFGSPRAETQEVSTDGTTRTYMGVALSDSEDGTVVVDLGGDVTLPDDLYDSDGNVVAEWDGVGVEMSTSPQVLEGEDVIVTLVGGSATKVPMVTAVAGSGDRMRTLVNAAQTIANAAQAVAEAINQHFFADTNGIHVTEVTQEEWDESHTGANVLINSIGQLFRDGLNNLLTLTTENGARALTIWDGLGNAAENIRAIIGETIHLGNQSGQHVSISSSSTDFYNEGGTMVSSISGYTETLESEFHSVRIDHGLINAGASKGTTIDGTEEYDLDTDDGSKTYDNRLVLQANDPDEDAEEGYSDYRPRITLTSHRWESSDGQTVTKSDTIEAKSHEYVFYDLQNKRQGNLYPISYVIESHDAAIGLRSPIGTYTGTNTTATASANGWQLTYFNTVVAEVGSPRTYDYTFSNGVLTANRDCVLEISGVMNWYDAIDGLRGFGIFEGTTAGSGTEHSAFQSFAANVTGNRKSVVFPPKLFTLTAGSSLTFGRYQQQNAVYQNGTNYSWLTIRVVG